jgi:hypothetical protein
LAVLLGFSVLESSGFMASTVKEQKVISPTLRQGDSSRFRMRTGSNPASAKALQPAKVCVFQFRIEQIKIQR